MIGKIEKATFEWIDGTPSSGNKIALLIPQYNEASYGRMVDRLEHFKATSQAYRAFLDIILIDDGSTDDSLVLLKNFKCKNPEAFFLASVTPNFNKVGALYRTVLEISHEVIILSDFDTDISGLQSCANIFEDLVRNPSLMGYYFRMLPFEGKGPIFTFQQLEYSLHRSLYKFQHRERTVPVMPGAGSVYKRSVLLSIYEEHSGLRSGEDREATLLGIKMGYQTLYRDDVQTLTRTPPSFIALVRQRIRWNLGYIETFFKEKKFYMEQFKKGTAFGIRTFVDILEVVFLVMFPFMMLLTCIMAPSQIPLFLGVTYGLYIVFCINLIVFSPREFFEVKSRRIISLLCFPFIKVSVECLSWMVAIVKFIRRIDQYKVLNR